MSQSILLGADGGATKTDCLLVTMEGRRLALASAGPSNHEHIGYQAAAHAVSEVVREALKQAGAARSDVAAACFAMAGMDLPPDRDHLLEEVISPLALDCPVTVVNDSVAGFRAGSTRGKGVGVSVGSGTVFCGANEQGRMVHFELPRAGDLADRLVRALVAEHYGAGPKCGFADAFLAEVGLTALKDLAWSMYSASRRYVPAVDPLRLASARRVVFQPQFADDPVLMRILADCGDELAGILVGLAGSLGLCGEQFDLVLSGSILTQGRSPILNGHVIDGVTACCPRANAVVVDGVPATGAVIMAAELIGKDLASMVGQ